MQGKPYLIGVSANQSPCPVCNVTPQIFRATSVKTVIECGRCGLPSMINPDIPDGQQIPQPLAVVAWINVFRRYWEETKQKLTTPEIVGPDIELAGRMKQLGAWLRENQDFVAQATIGTVAPYTSITAVVAQVVEADGTPSGVTWSLFLPNDTGVGASLRLPFAPEGLAIGTIVTIQTPVTPPGGKS